MRVKTLTEKEVKGFRCGDWAIVPTEEGTQWNLISEGVSWAIPTDDLKPLAALLTKAAKYGTA